MIFKYSLVVEYILSTISTLSVRTSKELFLTNSRPMPNPIVALNFVHLNQL